MCIILKVKGPVVIVLTGRQPLARLSSIYIHCLHFAHEVFAHSVVGCRGYRGERGLRFDFKTNILLEKDYFFINCHRGRCESEGVKGLGFCSIVCT